MKKEGWVWMPHAAHLSVGDRCRFRLATCVGAWVVSTVGEWLPDETTREIIARSRGVALEGIGDEREADFLRKCGFVELGYRRTYETMVFAAAASPGSCCAWHAAGGEVDFQGYSDPASAYAGHMELCERWANVPAGEKP